MHPWKDVLLWFAKQADLSLVILETVPSGTFNYTDTREYTPAEAIDLLNSILLTKGFYLVRQNRMLYLANVEEKLPPNLVPNVPVESLDKIGSSEFVNVHFKLSKFRPEDVEAEIPKLLGPQGSITSLSKSQELSVTDTGGRLRTVRDYLKYIEGPEGPMSSGLKTFHLKRAKPEEVVSILGQLLGIPDGKTAALDGSIRVSQDAGNDRLLVSGRPDLVARTTEIIERLEGPAPGEDINTRLMGTPQLEIYPLNGCDGPSVMAILQTVLGGAVRRESFRRSQDGQPGGPGTPRQHVLIRNTLKQLQLGAQKLEVIHLARLEPQSAMDAINRLFSPSDPKQASATAPQVSADSMTHQLLIHATEAQIVQIRDLLTKMGEPLDGSVGQSRVRTLQMSEGSARAALLQIEKIWPAMRPNRIRIISPPGGSGSTPPTGAAAEPSGELPPPTTLLEIPSTQRKRTPPLFDARPEDYPQWPEEKLQQKPQEVPKAEPGQKVTTAEQERRVKLFGARILCVADPAAAKAGEDKSPAEAGRGQAPGTETGQPRKADVQSSAQAGKGKSPADIVVIAGPNGLTITSDDLEALDEFEQLLSTATGNEPMAVFYLKNAKAADVEEELDTILAGGASADSSESSTLSASRRALATGPIKITPEVRLNALLVLANRADQNTVERLLKILDLEGSPVESGVTPKPRMIPVEHARARDIADVLRQVYADRLILSAGEEQRQGRGGGGGFLPMLMQGMGGGGGFGGGPGGGGGRRRTGRAEPARRGKSNLGRRRHPHKQPGRGRDGLHIRRGQTVGPATRPGGRLAK